MDIITETKVTDVRFAVADGVKRAVSLSVMDKEGERSIALSDDDLLFITPGGCVENSTLGSQHERAEYSPELKKGGGWDLWKRIASQSDDFGHPEKFCSDPLKTTWMSVDRGVPEVWGSAFDVRDLVRASVSLRDGSKLTEMEFGLKEKIAIKEALKRIHGTDIKKLLAEYGAI